MLKDKFEMTLKVIELKLDQMQSYSNVVNALMD